MKIVIPNEEAFCSQPHFQPLLTTLILLFTFFSLVTYKNLLAIELDLKDFSNDLFSDAFILKTLIVNVDIDKLSENDFFFALVCIFAHNFAMLVILVMLVIGITEKMLVILAPLQFADSLKTHKCTAGLAFSH